MAERSGRLHAEQDVSGSVCKLRLPLPGPFTALPSFLNEGGWCSPSLGEQGLESQDMLSSSEVGFAACSFHAAVRFPSHICIWGALEQLPQFSLLSPVLSDSAHHWSLSLPRPHHEMLLTAARYLLTVVACCPVLAAVLCRALTRCLALLFLSLI